VTSTDTEAVAVALAELRGEIATGLARIEGSLAVLVERSQRAERDIAELRSDTEEDLRGLRQKTSDEIGTLCTRIAALEDRRWPLPAVGVLTGASGLLVSLWEALH
jgi:hypothetical protein